MLYSIFLYQTKTGLLYWEKSFKDQFDPNQAEIISSFLSAINKNVKEMLTNSNKGLKNIEMGDLIVIITEIENLGIDMVNIVDKDDDKAIRKIIPDFIKIFKDNNALFEEFDGNLSKFEVLDSQIVSIIEKNKKLFKIKQKFDTDLKKIEIHPDKRSKFLEERNFLEDRLKNTISLPKKIEIINSIDHIDRKLKDKINIEKNRQRRKKLNTELENTKNRMKYFLEHTKEAINSAIQHSHGKPVYDADFKDAYLNLYSFSSKLKLIGRDDLCAECREIAKIFIDKPAEQVHNFPDLIKKVLNFPEDMESYLN